MFLKVLFAFFREINEKYENEMNAVNFGDAPIDPDDDDDDDFAPKRMKDKKNGKKKGKKRKKKKKVEIEGISLF